MEGYWKGGCYGDEDGAGARAGDADGDCGELPWGRHFAIIALFLASCNA